MFKPMKENNKRPMTHKPNHPAAPSEAEGFRSGSFLIPRPLERGSSAMNNEPRAMSYFRQPVVVMVVLGMMTTTAYAQPLIDSVGGAIADRESITVSGSGFGLNLLDTEWLGGPDGNIEQGADSTIFSKTKWSADSDSGGFYAPRYSSTRAHSGSKSIVSQYPQVSHYGSGYKYDYGSEFGTIYATWWVYFDHVDSSGQWKKWRLSPTASWNNTDGEIEQGDFFKSDGTCSQALLILLCNPGNLGGDYSQCYPDSNAGYRWISCQLVKSWVRLEFYAKESSSQGIRDGTFIYNIHKQTEPVTNIKNWEETIITRAIGVSDRWRYMKFQNYWGNTSGGDGTGEKVYIDDVYIQIGTRARVEIGDNATWINCTHREIQHPSAWLDTSIAITINQGSFQDGEAVYLFVVDADGNPSDGYPVTFASGPSGDITGDSLVNIQDIQACVNHILGTQDWGGAADVNNDNAVNVLDVQEIVNIILSG